MPRNSPRCEHGRSKFRCRDCGAGCCEHDQYKNSCKDCARKGVPTAGYCFSHLLQWAACGICWPHRKELKREAKRAYALRHRPKPRQKRFSGVAKPRAIRPSALAVPPPSIPISAPVASFRGFSSAVTLRGATRVSPLLMGPPAPAPIYGPPALIYRPPAPIYGPPALIYRPPALTPHSRGWQKQQHSDNHRA